MQLSLPKSIGNADVFNIEDQSDNQYFEYDIESNKNINRY